MKMKRREFLSRSLAGSAFALGLGKNIFAQEKTNFAQIAEERNTHPIYFDGLSFLNKDRDVIRKSGLSGFIWDVSYVETVGEEFHRKMIPCLKSIARASKFLRENDQGLFLATKGSQVKEANRTGKTAVFLQFQSTRPITEDLDIMNVFYELGLRILQLAHHCNNPFAGGALVKEWTGLTELGFKAVEKMNELGIIPDLSHASDKTAHDVLKTSKKPVIISHTGCRAIVRNARCIPDSVIKSVADSGGVIGIFSMSFWLTKDPIPTVDSYIKQLEHIIKVGGIDVVGISNDYSIAGNSRAAKLNNNNAEAVKTYYPWWKKYTDIVMGFEELPKHCVIPELNNVRRFFTIQAALEKRGYIATQIEKIMGGNWVRVLTECLG